jgi:hypothetical protein
MLIGGNNTVKDSSYKMINFYEYHNGQLEDYDKYGIALDNVCFYHKTKQGHLLESILHILQKDPWGAFIYAKHIVGGRWLEGEPTIMNSPSYSFVYVKDVIKCRWPEAESIIATDAYFWHVYRAWFKISD